VKELLQLCLSLESWFAWDLPVLEELQWATVIEPVSQQWVLKESHLMEKTLKADASDNFQAVFHLQQEARFQREKKGLAIIFFWIRMCHNKGSVANFLELHFRSWDNGSCSNLRSCR